MQTFKDTKTGRLYIYNPKRGYYDLAATPKEPTYYGSWSNYSLLGKLTKGEVIEVDLVNERWVHPHLLKHIRQGMLTTN